MKNGRRIGSAGIAFIVGDTFRIGNTIKGDIGDVLVYDRFASNKDTKQLK